MGKRKKISTQSEKTAGSKFSLPNWAAEHSRSLSAAVLALFIVLSLLMLDPKPFVGGDNAVYVSLSRSLVQGKGLSEIWTPEAKPHTQYPFGFPLLLAPIASLKLPYAWYKLVPWLAGLLSLLTFGSLIRGEKKVLYALPLFLLAVNPYFLEYTHWVLSELPFTFFVLLTFIFLRRWEEKGGYRRLSLVIISAVFADHIRSAGMALYLGIFLHLLFKRKHKPAALFLIGCIALTIPWSLRNSHYGTSGGYLDQFLMRDPYQPELGFLGAGGLFQRFFANLKIYFINVLPRMMFPSLDNWGLAGGAPVIMLLTAVPAVVTLIYRIIISPKGYDWFALAYLGMAMLWPETWSDIRFLLPLLPFLLLYLAQGYGQIISRLFKRWSSWSAAVAVILLAGANLSADWEAAGRNLEANEHYTQDKYSGYDPAWRSFFSAAEWVKNNTPDNSIVISRKPALFYLGSERRSFCYPFTTDQDSLLKAIESADQVMVEPVSGTGQRFLIPAIQPLIGQKYQIIYGDGNPPTYVLQRIKEKLNAK